MRSNDKSAATNGLVAADLHDSQKAKMSDISKINTKNPVSNGTFRQREIAPGKFALAFGLLIFVFCGNAQAQKTALIAFDGVEIFSLPLDDQAPIAQLMQGDTVRVIGQRGPWVKVEFAPGKKGWMQVQVSKGQPKNAGRRSPRARGQRSSGHMGSAAAFAKRGTDGASASLGNTGQEPHAGPADEIVRQPARQIGEKTTGKFGYAFGMGMLETDFAYNWKFVFHQTPRLALEGSFKHALGQAANSYLLMANWTYLLQAKGRFLPYLTAGMGVINTVPERSIDTGGVSHMAVNYGAGVRKFFRNNITFLLGGSMYTVFVGKGVRNFKELTLGLMVGKFWD